MSNVFEALLLLNRKNEYLLLSRHYISFLVGGEMVSVLTHRRGYCPFRLREVILHFTSSVKIISVYFHCSRHVAVQN